jgi:hypothetical protein
MRICAHTSSDELRACARELHSFHSDYLHRLLRCHRSSSSSKNFQTSFCSPGRFLQPDSVHQSLCWPWVSTQRTRDFISESEVVAQSRQQSIVRLLYHKQLLTAPTSCRSAASHIMIIRALIGLEDVNDQPGLDHCRWAQRPMKEKRSCQSHTKASFA